MHDIIIISPIKICRIVLLILLFLFCADDARSQNVGSVSGVVIDKMTQKPIALASIILSGDSYATITDSSGYFYINGIPVGSYNIEASHVGFNKNVYYNVSITSGNDNNVTIELERGEGLSEVVIRSNRRTAKAATLENPLSVQRLTSEEIKASPGGNFDISKAIQTLPGVGGGQTGGSFRNDIIIRGGAPNENVFYLDGVEIPVLNHFQTQGSSGGPQGMLNVSFIEDVKLSTSAFDAKYDNALSSVFQFRQKSGNPNKLQGNVRLSASDAAITLEGPLAKNKRTTFLFSARRSYLQLLFSVLDLPIRPNYWDFQTKITKKINDKTTLSFIGLAGIDEFQFATIKNATPEKLYVLNSNPIINQWNFTGGLSLKRLINNGYINFALSRNFFDNDIKQYEDNEKKLDSQITLDYASREIENKFRCDITQNKKGWKLNYGATVQYVQYFNETYNVLRKQIEDSNGNIVQPATIITFTSPMNNFWKYGAFVQIGRRFFDNLLGISGGIRSDMNTLTNNGNNPLNTISPRVSFNYTLSGRWTLNASIGRYYKIPPYTILGFADSHNNSLVNKGAKYLRCDHYVAGVEYLPNDALRFTAEGFYKKYANVPVSIRDSIALSNFGNDFTVLGNEPVVTRGRGRAFGFEFFVQKKLTSRFFGIFSFTFYRSEYSGLNLRYIPSSWDNQHLLSVTIGYKFSKNWELGIKFRFQGSAPYTPFDEAASRLNYQSLGQGVLDYARLNTNRLKSFNSSDLRVDKKWNFKKVTIDVFLDVTNWYMAKSYSSPSYTFKRNETNTDFLTADGAALRADGSNAIPILLNNDDKIITPTIGFILEF